MVITTCIGDWKTTHNQKMNEEMNTKGGERTDDVRRSEKERRRDDLENEEKNVLETKVTSKKYNNNHALIMTLIRLKL